MVERLPLLGMNIMKTEKNTAVILARVSSKAQEDEGYSLDSQLKLLQNYCVINGLQVVKVYKIAETASKGQSRKVFTELLAYLYQNKVYNLAVEKTDRLTRNLKDAVAIDDWLQADGDCMLHAVKENIKLHRDSKSDVKFMWNIHLAVAKKYTDNLREEAMKGWTEKLAQGWLPSRPPIGYMTAIQNGKRIHVPDPKKAPYIVAGFEHYVSALGSIESVWALFKQAGITTYNDHPLVKSAVHKLLNNPYYIGIIKFNGETYAGSHEQIISKQLYQAVQTKMHGGKPSKRCRHETKLQNILRCGHCGKIITWESHKGHNYGACQRDLASCKNNKYLKEEIAEKTLVGMMNDLVCPSPAIINWLIKNLDKQYLNSKAIIVDRRQCLSTQRNRLEKMDEMLYDDKLAGEISKERYEIKHVEILKQIEQAKDELLIADQTSLSQHKKAIDLIRLTQCAKDEYLGSDLTIDAKRTILTELFDSATYRNNFLSVKYTKFVEAIAKRNQKTKQIMEDAKMLNRTNKKDPNNGGHSVDKAQIELLCPLWQGHTESNHDPRFWKPIY